MMSSWSICRAAASVSCGLGGSISRNMAIITSTQPSRIRESVPSKSNKTWLMPGRGAKPAQNSTTPRNEPVENICRSVESVSLKSQSCGASPFIPVGKAGRNLLLQRRHMNSISSQTTRRAFVRSAAAATGALAVLSAAAAHAATSSATRKRNIKLGLDNFSVRALGWKAGQLIDYAASLRTDSLFITDLNAFEKFDDDYLRDLRKKAADNGLQLHLGSWSICPTSKAFKKDWGSA